jgi:DNA helicase-2/ATP-dependent DNA helicase PcrA
MLSNEEVATVPSYLTALNQQQLEAVTHTEGPLLVLAGAGTGKTRVLTTRIAHILMERKAFPSQILAVTFTNKAAKEMKERVSQVIDEAAEGIWLGTFHSIAAKILRINAAAIGLTRDFIILDYDDQIRLIKQLFKDRGLDPNDKKNSPKLFIHLINKFKDKAQTPNNVPANLLHERFADFNLVDMYRDYQQRLLNNNAVDFGDLTMLNIELFNNNPDICQEYQNKFRYILVDEYQDTNVAQYLWLKILTQGTHNICCVGDDDQSIYGWRGAEIKNILRFEDDFPDARIIRLERNYRSTNNILAAATALISNNDDRHGKSLWTEGSMGEKIKINGFYDDKEEAKYIANAIDRFCRQDPELSPADIAILVRSGYQTRVFEEVFNIYHIPYQIIGGMKFYERMEIKDALAYIRLINNQNDSLALERVVNLPKRGIGPTTMQHLHMTARENDCTLTEAVSLAIQGGMIRGKAAEVLTKFIAQIRGWAESLTHQGHATVVSQILEESGYIQMWKDQDDEESKTRLENLKELINSLDEFENLQDYLEHVSLLTDNDADLARSHVKIMTMHAAKGLEFNTVFLPGWEEGSFPSIRSIEEKGTAGLEEERRLAYVAITRAKRRLYISYTSNRRIYGKFQDCTPSRFFDELPFENYEIINDYGYLKSKRNSYDQMRNDEVSRKLSGYVDSWQNSPSPHAASGNFDDGYNVAPEDESQEYKPQFRKGQVVEHPKFGRGIIISIEGDVAHVAFDRTSMKKVMLDYIKPKDM